MRCSSKVKFYIITLYVHILYEYEVCNLDNNTNFIDISKIHIYINYEATYLPYIELGWDQAIL